MYRRLALVSIFVAVIMAVIVYSGVDEYAKSGQFSWGTFAFSAFMAFFAFILTVKATSNVKKYGPVRSDVLTNRDWDAENRLKQMKHRQAALRD